MSPVTQWPLIGRILTLIARSEVAVYMDNILIYTTDLNHHCIIVCEVLGRLREYDLYLKPSKCAFKQQEIKYLGMII